MNLKNITDIAFGTNAAANAAHARQIAENDIFATLDLHSRQVGGIKP